MKSGVDAWRTAARPESSRSSPHASSQKGIDALKSARTTSGRAKRRSSVKSRRHPIMKGTAGRSVSVATNTRPKTTTPGSSSRTATLMNMNDEPQIAASASSMVRWRRPTEGKT